MDLPGTRSNVNSDGNVELLRQCPVRFQTRVVGCDAFVLRHYFAKHIEQASCAELAQFVRSTDLHMRVRGQR